MAFRVSLQLYLLLFLSSFLSSPLNVSAEDHILFDCSNNDSNFTANSTYQSNLRLLLSSLPSAATPTGFSVISRGHPPDQVFGRAFCLGSATHSVCQSCLSAAAAGITTLCPFAKRAATWYDHCFVRYSDTNTTTSSEDSYRYTLYNVNNVSDPSRFEELYNQLMDSLSDRAAYESSNLFATGETNYTSSVKMYGLVQCMRDRSQMECRQCLQKSEAVLPNCCWGKQGGVVLAYNCYLRMEIYSYYDEALNQLPPPPSPLPPLPTPVGAVSSGKEHSAGKNSKRMVAFIIIPSVIGLVVFMVFLIYIRRMWMCKGFSNTKDERQDVESLIFTLDTIIAATDNFSYTNKVGEGGFGSVYKGILQNGREIAVKRLSINSRQGILELKNEVALVAKLQHKNLVRLLGFCLQGNEKCLIYEFLPHKSLDKFLSDPQKRGELDWRMRHKIIEGIARGLLYLHEDSQLKVIHRDLKTSNILLDQGMNPKISDFGFAKTFEMESTQGSASRIVGTNGYIAPEYAMYGRISTKLDVYSYGVVILEVLTGRRITDFPGSGCAANLLSFVWRKWSKGTALQIMDRILGEKYNANEALRCIHIGLLCAQEDPTKRPDIGSVLLMLRSNSMNPLMPLAPGFLVQGSTTTNDAATEDARHDPSKKPQKSCQNKRERNAPSVNYASITEMEPR